MLTLPANYSPFKVLSIDPGSKNMGIAVLEDKLDGSKKLIKSAQTFLLKDNHPAYTYALDIHGSLSVRLMVMRDILINFIRTERPHAVIIESNYLGKFAQSFAVLTECVAVARSVLYEYDPFIPLYTVDPTTVKTNAGMKKIKGTDKEDVKRALISRQDLDWHVNPHMLDEHSIDACAIGYYYLTNLV